MTELKFAIIYKIVCKDLNVNNFYVGSTLNFKSRKNQHKKTCYNLNDKNYNLKIYTTIREIGGWDNWDMIEIEVFSFNNKNEIRIRERYWYDVLSPNLNMILPQRSLEEKIEYNNQYLKNHKEDLKEKRKIYRDNDEIKAKENIKMKEYYMKNKEHIRNLQKQKKNICDCGSTYRSRDKAQHIKTKKHIDFISNLISFHIINE